MTKSRIWRGVRMRDTEAAADPDAPPRLLTLPAAWDDRAAAALAALAPGVGAISLARAATAWISPIAALARAGDGDGGDPALADRLHALLLRRRAAPTAPFWAGPVGPRLHGEAPGWVLNLPAFHDGATGFDVGGFAEAVATAGTALRLSDPAAPRFAIAITGLDGLLAALGLDYDSAAARVPPPENARISRVPGSLSGNGGRVVQR